MTDVGESYRKEALRILSGNVYLVLSTADKDNSPWGATVFFAYDSNFDFYFLSAVDSRHAENLEKNPKVSFVIFNSKQQIGYAEGVQGEGTAAMVEDVDLEKVIKIYCDRLFPNSQVKPTERYPPQNYSGAAEFRFFKISVSKVFVTGTVDRRTEVSLK